MRKFAEKAGRRFQELLLRASRPLQGTWPRPADAVIGLLALLVVLFAVSTFSTRLASKTSEFLSENKYLALINGLFNPYRTQHLLLNSGLPVYDLNIRKQQYALIEDAVAKARRQGWMDDGLKVWADARFIHDGTSYNVKLRVRGDLSPHWKGPKKSWRIKFGRASIEEGGETRREPVYFQGRRQINLIIPSDRDYILSYFINSLMRDHGLVVPRDRFVVLRINGAVQGLYYEVEHFDKPLFAAQRKPETTVFAQNDRAMHFEQYTRYGAPAVSDARFDIGSVRRLVDQESEMGLRALQVLMDHSLDPTPENFRRVRSVLDWDKYLRFRVMTTLFNTNHVRFGSDNLRLYYDQSRGLLEPIPWDVHITRLPKEPGTIDFWNSKGPDEIQRATLLDPELRKQRNEMLWELVSDRGEALLSRYDEIHEKVRPLAWADVLTTPIGGHKMDGRRSEVVYNLRRIHKVLSLSSANLAYRLQSREQASIDFAATNFSGVRLETIEVSDPGTFAGPYRLFEDANANGRLDASDPLLAEAESSEGTIRFDLDRYVFPELRYGGDEIDGRYWEYYETLAGRVHFLLTGRLAPEKRHPLEWQPPAIRVAASNAVTGSSMESGLVGQQDLPPDASVGILAYDASRPYDLDAQFLSRAEFLANHPAFRESPDIAGAVELAGNVSLDATVIVPRGVPLVLAPGTDLTMRAGANLLSYGGFSAIGSAEEPIRIHGDESGEAWGVIAVVRPPEEVIGRHIEVRDGGQAKLNGILFTGGFAVHDGDLRLEECRFRDMRSEDGVNLKNGRITMRDCAIRNGSSDGMDLDFVTGEVRDSIFAGNAGDGLDLSGSRLVVAGNRFEYNGDKGISVGEDSHPIIVNNLMRGNPIGISTKDLSFARVAHSTFVDNDLAIEAKRKKPMFGGGGGEFVNNVFSGNVELLKEDYFSRGRVRLLSSLADDRIPACTSCGAAVIRFASLERGDYRLAPGGADASAPPAVRREWAALEGQPSPSTPGILTPLPDPSWKGG